MVDRGPLLTSAIIFYLSIGAAIFQVLEEPNWKQATKDFDESKTKILEKYTCLTLRDLEDILEVRYWPGGKVHGATSIVFVVDTHASNFII